MLCSFKAASLSFSYTSAQSPVAINLSSSFVAIKYYIDHLWSWGDAFVGMMFFIHWVINQFIIFISVLPKQIVVFPIISDVKSITNHAKGTIIEYGHQMYYEINIVECQREIFGTIVTFQLPFSSFHNRII